MYFGMSNSIPSLYSPDASSTFPSVVTISVTLPNVLWMGATKFLYAENDCCRRLNRDPWKTRAGEDVVQCSPFTEKETEAQPERLSNLPIVTQLNNGERARTGTQVL